MNKYLFGVIGIIGLISTNCGSVNPGGEYGGAGTALAGSGGLTAGATNGSGGSGENALDAGGCITLTDCYGSCVDLSIDKHNCGMCGNTCSAGEICDNSECKCPPENFYNGMCLDMMNDPSNCGSYGNACPNQASSLGVCSNGHCCTSDFPDFCDSINASNFCQPSAGGYCCSSKNDYYNCGACRNSCTDSHKCCDGVCKDDC